MYIATGEKPTWEGCIPYNSNSIALLYEDSKKLSVVGLVGGWDEEVDTEDLGSS